MKKSHCEGIMWDLHGVTKITEGQRVTVKPNGRVIVKPQLGDVWEMANGRRIRIIPDDKLIQDTQDHLIPVSLVDVYWDENLDSKLCDGWNLVMRVREAKVTGE